jgi:hypothetical protein
VSLQVLVNGFDITNGVTHFLNYRETEGLFDPASLVDPEAVDTFEGPFRVRQTTTDYGMRTVKIVGRLNCRSLSYADKLRALNVLQSIYEVRPSRVAIGSLELQVDFGRVQIYSDEMKRLNSVINYTVEGTAIPATLSSSVSTGTGYVQGLAVDTARVNEAATLATMASGVGTITVLGDAPTPAVITIQGAVSTTYYLATSSTGRRVPITTDSNGVGRIDERSGFYLTPGVNRITAYQAATGTTTFTDITVMSLFGTTWRFTGNAAAGIVTRYDLGPALTTNRTGSARYFLGNTNPTAGGTNGIVTAGDDEPRIGWSWLNRRNLFINSNDLSSSTATTITGIGTNIYQIADPDGGLRGYRAISNASSSYITYSTSKMTSGAIVVGVQYTFSVYLRSTGASNTISAYIYDNTSSTSTSWAVTSTWTRFSITRTVANTSGWAIQIGGTDWTTGEGIELYGPQFELGASPTAYQATDANGIAIDHPANDAGLVLEGLASNLVPQSQFASGWSPTGLTSITLTNVAPDASSTAYQAESNAADSSLGQTVSGLSAGSTYTFSLWMRTTSGINTINIYINEGGVNITSASCTVTTNWTRFTVTRTLTGTSAPLQIGGGATWSTGEVLQLWGAQLELGTAATSYIPTTTASARREADICGVLNPHNLAINAEDLSSSTGTAWFSTSRWTSRTIVSATTSASPNGTGGVTRLISDGTVTSGNPAFCRQRVSTGSSTVYTFSIWLKGTTTGTAFIAIRNAVAGGLGSTTCNLTTSWQRFSVTVTNGTANDSIIIDLFTQTVSQTIDAFGAQVTEGYLPGRYVRTTDTQVLPTTAIDPSWSQNGYIEFDAIWAPRVSGVGEFLGDTAAGDTGAFFFRTDKSGNWVVFSRRDVSNTNRNILFTSATVHDRGYGKIRAEWTNYTLSGNQFMFLRIYVDGVLGQEINYTGTAGTAWPVMSMTRLSRMAQTTSALGSQGTISNLTLGVPLLPQGATPAGI